MITINLHDPFLWLSMGYLLVSTVAASMPDPAASSSGWYVFAYRFVHALAANWDKVGPPKK